MLSSFPISPALAASDLERARAFYEEVLGFKPHFEYPEGVFYTSGEVSFEVYQSQFAGTNQATAAGWHVDDLDREVTELRERGVKFEEYDFGEFKTVEGILTAPDGIRAAWFKDPEGNILGLFQPGEMAES